MNEHSFQTNRSFRKVKLRQQRFPRKPVRGIKIGMGFTSR